MQRKKFFQRVPRTENSPLNEGKKGDVCSKAILMDISQRKRLFDLEITRLGERNWRQSWVGTCVKSNTVSGAREGLGARCARSQLGSSCAEQAFRTSLV